MFNNLIESSSHAKEFKRRGSFLLFTTATYLVLFVITGVVSIYAYDAHLENQATELELTFIPLPPEESAPTEPRNTIRPTSNSSNNVTSSTRTVLMDSTSNPNNPPPNVGVVASSVPPARVDSVLGPSNGDPITPGSTRGSGSGAGTGSGPVVEIVDPPPPPATTPAPVVPKVIRSPQVLNSIATYLPKPIYPPLAKQIRLQGVVNVQVLVDETGRVVSAKAVSGHTFFINEAQKAALQARFSPAKIGDQPVKVSGVISYNFILQQ
jgi:TonB family protein